MTPATRDARDRLDGWTILDCVPESVLITDAALDRPGPTVVYVNPAFERMTGWPSAEIVGRSPRLLQGPLTEAAIFADLRETLSAGRSWRGRGVNYRRNGEAYWLDWSITPLFCGTPRPQYFVAVQRDVSQDVETERRATEAALAKSDFLAMMTHELRMPLSIIIGHANFLIDPDMTDLAQFKRSAELIRQSGESLMETVTEILDHAKSGSGMIELAFVDIDLRFQLEEVISALTASAEMRGATIALDAPDSALVTADEMRVQQVLLNVIGNAIKHGREGGRVAVTLSGDEHGAAILVADDGPGVPEEMRERIFEPFVQLRSPLSASKPGVGLGLAIVKRFMALHAGSVEILPGSDGGARFRLWFPRLQSGGSVS